MSSTPGGRINRLWYNEKDDQARAEALTNTARALWNDQGENRRRMADDAMTLWAGTMAHSLAGASPASMLGLNADLAAAGYNVVQAIVDTKYNDTLRNEIRPLFITEGGDSELREKVAAQQEACDGQSYTLGLDDEIEEQACLNGYIFGNGGQEFWSDTANSRAMVTPAWYWQYFVSRQEARNGAPQQCFSRHAIQRDVLLAFLEGADSSIIDAVKGAPSASYEDARDFDTGEAGTVADLVVIYKGWHLPSCRVDLSDPAAFGKTKLGPDGKRAKASHDGLHMVTLDWGGGKSVPPLLVRAWPYDHYPVAWFKPNRMPGSYWGRGEPEILAATQIESNQWNERTYNILDRYARPGVVLSKGAKLNPAQINNGSFNIWQVEGNPNTAMTVLNQPAVPQELIARLDRLPQQARDQRGMSEMSMAARRPAGIEHKPGLKYLKDMENVRHTAEYRAWRRYKLDGYKNILRCLSELSEHDPKFEVVFEKDKQLTRQRWSDINVDSQRYRVKAKGTNLFSRDPAQQAEQIADFVERGLLPPSAMYQIDAPDFQAMIEDKDVMRLNAIARVKAVIRGPEYDYELMPDPTLDLQICKTEALKAKNKLDLNGETGAKIDRITAFIADVDALLGIGAPPPPAPGGPGQLMAADPAQAAAAGAGMPGGPPGATVAAPPMV